MRHICRAILQGKKISLQKTYSVKKFTKNDAPANANLAKCLYRQNRFAEADSAATIALNSAKDKKDILYDRGNIAYKQQDYSKSSDGIIKKHYY